MSRPAAVLTTLGVVLLGALITVGGYLGGWWLRTDTVNRESKLNRKSFERQATYRDEMVRKISDVGDIDLQIVQSPEMRSQLDAQRRAVIHIICRDNTYIQGGLDSDTATFVGKEC